MEYIVQTLRITVFTNMTYFGSVEERLLQLNYLDEFRMQALLHTEVIQLQRRFGMINTSKKRHFKKDIGRCSMTPGSRISKEN